jgi:polyferredoxin
MPTPEPPAWAAVAIVALCGLNMAIGIFEVVFGRPPWLRRVLSRRGRLPATARDWRLYGAVTSLASGGIMLLAIAQGLTLGQAAPPRTSSARVLLVLAMGPVAVLMFVMAFVAFLRVEWRPRPGTGHRPSDG